MNQKGAQQMFDAPHRRHRLRTIKVAFILLTALAACRSEHVARELPIGNVDTPKPGEAAKNLTRVSGWALSKSGIDRVDAYLDGTLAATSHTGVSRPDVAAAYPNYENRGTPGFDFQVDVAGRSAGPHELTVQIRTSDDAVRELCRFPIVVSK
jgi:hypothetical protein